MNPSTSTAPSAGDFFQHGSSEQQRSQMACTYVITGIGDPKRTGNDLYFMADIIVEPTRGSQKIFPRLMAREEMFVPKFDPKVYASDKVAITVGGVQTPLTTAITNSAGRPSTLGTSLGHVCRMNVCPTLKVDKSGNIVIDKKTNLPMEPADINGLMAICGGTFNDGIVKVLAPRLATAFAAIPADRAVKELTAEEIVAVLREVVRANGRVELAAILKQSRDQSGALSDNYELARWQGPFTKALDTKLRETAAKTASNADVSKRVVIRYQS